MGSCKLHLGSAECERPLGSLEDLYHAKACPTVRERLTAAPYAFDEVLRLHAQGLRQAELRRHHVASPIADEQVMRGRGAVAEAVAIGQGDSLVVDLDLFARLDVVVDDHLTVP